MASICVLAVILSLINWILLHGNRMELPQPNKPTPIQGGGKDHQVLFVNLLCLPNTEEEQVLLCDQCLLYVPNNEDQCQIDFNKSQEEMCFAMPSMSKRKKLPSEGGVSNLPLAILYTICHFLSILWTHHSFDHSLNRTFYIHTRSINYFIIYITKTHNKLHY